MNGFYFIFKVYGIRDLQAIDLQRVREEFKFSSKKNNITLQESF